MFDAFFFKIVDYYKNSYKAKANKIATVYISFLQIALLFVFGVFFSKFFEQFHVETMSASKAWTLFIITSVFIYFKNWMQYAGRKLTVKKAKKRVTSKSKENNQSILTLWLLPFGCIALGVLLLNAF